MSTQKKSDKAKKTTLVRMETVQSTTKKSNSRKKKEIGQEEFSQNKLKKMIERRAYERFLERGSNHGNDWQDWFQAEHELKAKLQ
jgi:hypothetical protein